MISQKVSPHFKLFTLIELLVVISIIAILASMMLPAIGNARLRATRMQCMSQIKQVASLCISYAHESKEWLPEGVDTAYSTSSIFDGKQTVPLGMKYSRGPWMLSKGNAMQRALVATGFARGTDDSMFTCGVAKSSFFYTAHYATKNSKLWSGQEDIYVFRSSYSLRDKVPGQALLLTDIMFTDKSKNYSIKGHATGVRDGNNAAYLDGHADYTPIGKCFATGASGQAQMYLPIQSKRSSF